ncbi:hypothetical protein, partial [Deinococcus sonorensis]
MGLARAQQALEGVALLVIQIHRVSQLHGLAYPMPLTFVDNPLFSVCRRQIGDHERKPSFPGPFE